MKLVMKRQRTQHKRADNYDFYEGRVSNLDAVSINTESLITSTALADAYQFRDDTVVGVFKRTDPFKAGIDLLLDSTHLNALQVIGKTSIGTDGFTALYNKYELEGIEFRRGSDYPSPHMTLEVNGTPRVIIYEDQTEIYGNVLKAPALIEASVGSTSIQFSPTQSVLDTYEEQTIATQVWKRFDVQTNNFFDGGNSSDFKFVRIGNMITMTVTESGQSNVSTADRAVVLGVVPTAYRPAQNFYFEVLMFSGALNVSGLVCVGSSGAVVVSKPAFADFDIGNGNIFSFSCSWVL